MGLTDQLRDLRDDTTDLLTAFRYLWVVGFADHLDVLGRAAFYYRDRMAEYQECFTLLARVSRQAHGTFVASGSSSTEYVLRHCISVAGTLDRFVQGASLIKEGGLTPEDKAIYTKAAKVLSGLVGKSILNLSYETCVQMAADVEWEYQRALALLPPEKTPMATPGTVEVFFSYSHKDERLREKLVAHLSQLKNEGLIRDWHDRKIGAGTEWDGQINEHLTGAQVVLLLVSSDFLASRYIHNVEVKTAMERHEAGDARVIPVILRACDWHSAPFGKLQALPKDGKAVTSWGNKDEAFTDVVKGIRAVVKEMAPKPAEGAT